MVKKWIAYSMAVFLGLSFAGLLAGGGTGAVIMAAMLSAVASLIIAVFLWMKSK